MKEILEIEVTANNKAALSAFTQTQKSIFNLQLELEKYQSQAFTEKDAAKVRSYNAKIQELQTSIKQLSNVGKQGFDDLGNKLKEVNENGFNQIYSSVRRLAYILPGIGVAGIFNLAFEGLGKLVEEMGLFSTKEQEAAASAQKLNDAIAKQVEKGAEDISHMRALIAVAQDASLSVDKRKTAVKELQQLYPAYFKDLTVENALTKDLTSVTNGLTQSIYKRAEARAREADIAEKATKVFQNQQKIEQLNADIQKAQQERIKASQSRGVTMGFGGSMTGTASGTTSGADAFIAAQTKENNLLKQRDALLSENSQLQLTIAGSQNIVNQITAQTIDLDYKQEKSTKAKVEKLKEWHALVGAIRQTIPTGLTDKDRKELIPDTVQRVTKDNAAVQNVEALSEAMKAENLKAFNDQMKEFATYANIASEAIGNLFDELSKGMSIGDAIGKMFQDIANQIAKAAMKAIVFKLVMSLFSGGASDIFSAATGKGSFLDLFKGFFAGGAKGFAEGGTVSGPTSGYAAILHGTEHILRPDQLNRIVMGAAQMGSISPGGMNINVVGKVAGNDIWLSQQRTNYYRGLTAGG